MTSGCGRPGGWRPGRACPLCPGTSGINLFRYCERVIDLDAKIPNRALDLGMSQQELNGPQVACPSINQRSFRAAERMGTKQSRVQPNASDPLGDEAGILSSGHAAITAAITREQELAGTLAGKF